MKWRDMPSLAALRAFEVAARTGSFSAAALELNVTHAAVAQHVRALEARVGVSLLVREGRGMALTDDGAKLAMALAAGFGQIMAGVQTLTEDVEQRPLSISVTPTFAENWLMPRFSDFWAKHPGFDLSITPSIDVIDLRREGFDMAIRYGDGDWPGVEATHLVSADYTVVAAPSLLAGRRVASFEDLYDLPWFFESIHQEPRLWAEASGLDPARCQIRELATLTMLLSVIRAGAGVTVVASALVSDDLEKGRLVPLMQETRDRTGYYIIHDPGPLPDRVKTLKKWLLRAAKAPAEP